MNGMDRMTEDIYGLLMIVDIGTTLINLVILGLAVKLYTDQTKQGIFRQLPKDKAK